MFRDHARDLDHGASHLPPPHRQLPWTENSPPRCRKRLPDPDHESPYGLQGGRRVIRDRVGGSLSDILRNNQAGARSGPAAAARRLGGPAPGPRRHRGGPGCWSRPSLTASWPSLLLLITGFDSNAALPDVVLTATGRATLLSERTADSNREGHDAHPAPGGAHPAPGGALPGHSARPLPPGA